MSSKNGGGVLSNRTSCSKNGGGVKNSALTGGGVPSRQCALSEDRGRSKVMSSKNGGGVLSNRTSCLKNGGGVKTVH